MQPGPLLVEVSEGCALAFDRMRAPQVLISIRPQQRFEVINKLSRVSEENHPERNRSRTLRIVRCYHRWI